MHEMNYQLTRGSASRELHRRRRRLDGDVNDQVSGLDCQRRLYRIPLVWIASTRVMEADGPGTRLLVY